MCPVLSAEMAIKFNWEGRVGWKADQGAEPKKPLI
jgi:hypothetical protein